MLDLLNRYHAFYRFDLTAFPSSRRNAMPFCDASRSRHTFSSASPCPRMTDRFDGSRCTRLLPVFCLGMTSATARSQETDPREDRSVASDRRRPRYADPPFLSQGQRDHLDSIVMARGFSMLAASNPTSHGPVAWRREPMLPPVETQGVNQTRQPAQAAGGSDACRIRAQRRGRGETCNRRLQRWSDNLSTDSRLGCTKLISARRNRQKKRSQVTGPEWRVLSIRHRSPSLSSSAPTSATETRQPIP